jgi:dipeptidyl aminopeptidase/acylaminoacyl peptidase
MDNTTETTERTENRSLLAPSVLSVVDLSDSMPERSWLVSVKQTSPYGSWKSPITSDLIVSASIHLGPIVLDGRDTYWLEGRPLEAGRNVIVRRGPDGLVADVNPQLFNARTRVHEYGGGAYTVVDGVVYFSNFADQRLYRMAPGSTPLALTPAVDLRYADAAYDRRRGRLIAIREDHTRPGEEAVNTIVAIDLAAGETPGQVLVQGNNFYAAPRVSPDGTRLAWLAWNHPNMPWDGTELWVGEFGPDGLIEQAQRVAGGADESIFQPEWSPDGVLHFVSDRTNWWNLYRWRAGNVEPLCEMDAEFGEPQWGLGLSLYAFETPTRILCAYTQNGFWSLGRLDTEAHTLERIDCPYDEIACLKAATGRLVMLAGSPTQPMALVQYDLAAQRFDVLKTSNDLAIDPGYLAHPQPIEFPTEDGLTAFGFFYPPTNRDFAVPAGERPPLLVKTHGGPTGATSANFNLTIQFWTSRGIAVLDVNYGGSTGYGRAYRQRLNGRWGIVDVDDAVNGARYLAQRGDVDGERMSIDGGSAGGYTTLAALTFRDVFKAGASYYGISDLEVWTTDTHKYESRYLDRLIGPYPARRDLYVQRSPIHFVERIACPMILLQGLEDKVVPPNQAVRIFEAVKVKGLPVAYLPFEGEQHGFRKAENIKRALDAELYFYSRVFGFTLADPVEPVHIENQSALPK